MWSCLAVENLDSVRMRPDVELVAVRAAAGHRGSLPRPLAGSYSAAVPAAARAHGSPGQNLTGGRWRSTDRFQGLASHLSQAAAPPSNPDG